jgi:hypothetical protein
MKNITEFNVFNLSRALSIKNELATAGKTPEEISAGIGEAFKLEGDKLKYFVASLELIAGKTEKLKRVFVVSFAEGETVPASVQKVEEQHFILDYHQAPRAPAPADDGKRGKGRGGRDGGRGGPGGGRGGPTGGRGPGGSNKGPGGGDRKDAGGAPATEAKTAKPAKN